MNKTLVSSYYLELLAAQSKNEGVFEALVNGGCRIPEEISEQKEEDTHNDTDTYLLKRDTRSVIEMAKKLGGETEKNICP